MISVGRSLAAAACRIAAADLRVKASVFYARPTPLPQYLGTSTKL
jgi:hypothetical protein